MLVAFALRPELGATASRLVEWTRAGEGGELVWYKWLGLCPIRGVPWSCGLQPPLDGDRSCTAQLLVDLGTDPRCDMSWRIDENGNRVGPMTAPNYRAMRNLHPELSLPEPEAFQLQDRPPGQ